MRTLRDLYTDCELDDDGEWKRMVCKIVMGHNIFSGDDGVIAQVAEFLARPIVEAIAMVKAIGTPATSSAPVRPCTSRTTWQPAIDYPRPDVHRPACCVRGGGRYLLSRIRSRGLLARAQQPEVKPVNWQHY